MGSCNQAIDPPLRRVLNGKMCEHNNTGLAYIGLREINAKASPQGEVNSRKRKRNIDYLRAKRLRRNKRKKLAYQNQTSQERRAKIAQRLAEKYETKTEKTLKIQLAQVTRNYKKERRLSAFCWSKYKEELAVR